MPHSSRSILNELMLIMYMVFVFNKCLNSRTRGNPGGSGHNVHLDGRSYSQRFGHILFAFEQSK